jgi:hypothetical protein
MTAHRVDLRIESRSGDPLGRVLVGIPEEQFLQLIARFPEQGFSGQNPKVNEAIRDGITEGEKEKIAEYLGIPLTHAAFEFNPFCRFIDEAKEPPLFESNGKKFWISQT